MMIDKKRGIENEYRSFGSVYVCRTAKKHS